METKLERNTAASGACVLASELKGRCEGEALLETRIDNFGLLVLDLGIAVKVMRVIMVLEGGCSTLKVRRAVGRRAAIYT
jgi:hypothetical protein